MYIIIYASSFRGSEDSATGWDAGCELTGYDVLAWREVLHSLQPNSCVHQAGMEAWKRRRSIMLLGGVDGIKRLVMSTFGGRNRGDPNL